MENGVGGISAALVFCGKAFVSESPSLGIYSQCASRCDLSCKKLYFCVRNENTYHYQSVSMNSFLNFYISLLAAIFPSSGASSFPCRHALAREGWPRLLTAITIHEWMKSGSMSGDTVVEGLHRASRQLRDQWMSESVARAAVRASRQSEGPFPGNKTTTLK